LLISSQYVFGQNSDNDKEVKVKIIQKSDGDTKTIEKTFSAGDEEAIKELLKEFDLNIDADDVLKDGQVEINIRKSNGGDSKDIIAKIENDDERAVEPRAFLGVFVEDVDDYDVSGSQKPDKGAVVSDVIAQTPAEKAGLQKGDIITRVNDNEISNGQQFREAIRSFKPGDEISITYLRDGKENKVAATLDEKKEHPYPKFHPEDFGRDGMPPMNFHNGMPHCGEMWMKKFDDDLKENKDAAIEDLKRQVEHLERRLQELKEELHRLDTKDESSEKKTEETKVNITIEDVAKNNLTAENLVFSPNPNSGKFNLSFELPEKGKTTVKIFDEGNKEIYSESLGKFSGKYDRQIDVSENPKGIYFLQITQDNKTLNKKIVIQ
jgi:hypothetical protein